MYPSKKYKHYGVFVQNTAQILENNGYKVDVSALKKKDSKLGKLVGYLNFYVKSIFLCLFHHYDYLYAHYISHCALLIKIIKKIKPNIKVIVNVHGNDVVPEDQHDEKFIPLVRSTLPLIDICIVPSSYYQKVMMEQYGLDKNIVKIFPSGGINFDIFKDSRRFPAIKRVFVQLQLFLVYAAKHHGSGTAVTDRKGFIPVFRRFVIPQDKRFFLLCFRTRKTTKT